jgi:hypothetical protein
MEIRFPSQERGYRCQDERRTRYYNSAKPIVKQKMSVQDKRSTLDEMGVLTSRREGSVIPNPPLHFQHPPKPRSTEPMVEKNAVLVRSRDGDLPAVKQSMPPQLAGQLMAAGRQFLLSRGICGYER